MTLIYRLFLIVAIVCFTVALLVTVGVFSGTNPNAWEYGGLLSLTLALTVPVIEWWRAR